MSSISPTATKVSWRSSTRWAASTWTLLCRVEKLEPRPRA
jgi:hypothetical protein